MTEDPYRHRRKLIEDILQAVQEIIAKSPETADFQGVITNYALVCEYMDKDGDLGQQLIYSYPHPSHAAGVLDWAARGIKASAMPHRMAMPPFGFVIDASQPPDHPEDDSSG